MAIEIDFKLFAQRPGFFRIISKSNRISKKKTGSERARERNYEFFEEKITVSYLTAINFTTNICLIRMYIGLN